MFLTCCQDEPHRRPQKAHFSYVNVSFFYEMMTPTEKIDTLLSVNDGTHFMKLPEKIKLICCSHCQHKDQPKYCSWLSETRPH